MRMRSNKNQTTVHFHRHRAPRVRTYTGTEMAVRRMWTYENSEERRLTTTLIQGRFSFEFKRECGHIYRSKATWEAKASAILAETWARENTLCGLCRSKPETPQLDDAYSHMHHWRSNVKLKAGHFQTFIPLDVSFVCPKCRLYVFGAWYGSGYACANCALDLEVAAGNNKLQKEWDQYKNWSQVYESEEIPTKFRWKK